MSKLAEDNGLSKLLIMSDVRCGLEDLSAFAATSSAALTAAAVLCDLSCAALLIPGLIDLCLELTLSRYVAESDLCLDCLSPVDIIPLAP